MERLRIPEDTIDWTNELIFTMDPGDGLVFTNYTMHRCHASTNAPFSWSVLPDPDCKQTTDRSEPNRSGETRMFYAVAYQLASDAGDARL